MKLNKFVWLLVIVSLPALFLGCGEKKQEGPFLFQVLESKETGLDFTNKLTPTAAFNMFRYMYFYNGAGVGAGDFNNDGLIDLFFSANQGMNKLFLNKGNLKFTDVTQQARIPQDSGWSTGVSVTDINNDGLLDMYVCKVGQFEVLRGRNQLLVCTGIKDGIPTYVDSAAAYGLDFTGFSTQAAFLDYDMDGDLDMFLLNHSVHQNGTFAERKVFLGTYHPYSGDRLYRNDGRRFTDVTKESLINSSAISYGLGIAVGDIDLDGYPDMYVGNDFHENDYLYINQRNGTFSEEVTSRMMHTSQFSMGVDIGDINNDAFPDIVSVDMLPEDPYILKRSLGEDEYNIFNMKIGYGYNHQYAKNSLQLNRRNGMFSEVAMYSGVFATDWSWAPLFADFDNDGLKDLFISNGIPKRLNDIDYVNHVSNDEIQQKIRMNNLDEKDMALIDKFPEIKLRNKFYKNTGNAQFQDIANMVKDDRPTFSNGSVYADLDNDGDLDMVVNNISDPVLVYKNTSNDVSPRQFLKIILKGPSGNVNAVGAKAIVFSEKGITTYEKYPVKGFQSSMEVPLLIGLQDVQVDSIVVVWPDNTCQRADEKLHNQVLTLTYGAGLPRFDYAKLAAPRVDLPQPMEDITSVTGLLHRHQENPFVEFDREPLIPYMVSREGPALAVGDVDGNGLDDVFIGSSKANKSVLFVQQAGGKFTNSVQPALDNDSTYEDVDAAWADVNNDGSLDLVVASGGNEYYGGSEFQMPRVYLNDGKGNLRKLADAFDKLYLTASCVKVHDFTGDGFADLFIGGRAVPFEYGEIPQSYLLANDGKGRFRDVTAQYAPALSKAGIVKHAVWSDLDNDKDQDLLLSLEWDHITVFVNNQGSFTRKDITGVHGLWNFVLPVDVDKDGDLDLLAGNLGLNSRLKGNAETPVKLYFNDFDGNGKKEQLLTYYLGEKEIPFANKAELEKQIPVLKKKFLYADDFAKASLQDLIGKRKLEEASVLTADYFSNAILLNQGNLNFTMQALPWEAQLTSYRDAVVVYANSDSLPDILLAGNFYENNIQMGRYDADYGTILLNTGKGNFEPRAINGLQIRSQVRRISPISINGRPAFVLARNNDSTMLLRLR
jgi:enediyne biosynthesis protein E4